MTFEFATIGIAIGILAAFGCGRGLLHRPKPLQIGLLDESTALVLLKGCFILRPDWEFPLVQHFGLELGWLTGWWALIPFSLLLGYSTHFLPQSRRSIYFGFAGFFYLIFLLDGWFRLMTDYRDLNGKPDDQGVCLQSSEYSCGAVAAASFLFLLGYSSTEAEMARWCRPSQITGVNEYILAWAIKYLQQHQHSVATIVSVWRGHFLLALQQSHGVSEPGVVPVRNSVLPSSPSAGPLDYRPDTSARS